MRIKYLIALISFVCGNTLAARPTGDGLSSINVYTWWDYVSPKVRAKLKREGVSFNLVEYRSNEVALSKLLAPHSNFDAVIVSSWVLRVLEGAKLVDPTIPKSINRDRKYHSFLMDFSNSCVPYLWAATVFAYKGKLIDSPPNSIDMMTKLKGKGVKISLVDDSMEFAGRVIADNLNKCGRQMKTSNILDMASNCTLQLPSGSQKIGAGDFRNSIKSFLGPNTSVLGWNGEIGAELGKHPDLEFVNPKDGAIIGADFLCVLNRKKKKPGLTKFVKLLTDKQSTNIHVREFQYFSPYTDLVVTYHPKVERLFREVLDQLKSGRPLFLYPPADEKHQLINQWWRTVRFGVR